MAKFKCEKHPGLIVIGAGKFHNGELEVTGAEPVRKVKAAAKRFGITEVKATPARSKPADAKGSQKPAGKVADAKSEADAKGKTESKAADAKSEKTE